MTFRPTHHRSFLWGFAAGGLLFVIGAPLPHAVLAGLAIIATAPVLRAASIELHDRPEVPRHLRREGSRRELSRLTRYRGRRTRGTDEEAVRRLRAVVHRRMSDLGIDADDPVQAPEAHRLLGPLAYGVLIGRTAPPPIADRDFSHCIVVVEGLARRRHDHEVGHAANAQGTT